MYFKKLIIEAIQEHLLTEVVSDIVYHYTYLSNLTNIIKENKFHASSNIGSISDLNVSRGKFFFFSTTRSKQTGYNLGSVCIVLNGRKLNQKYKGFAMDYWQYSKNPKDYDTARTYKMVMQKTEDEDRIILDKPSIDNAWNYILETHILVTPRNMSLETIKYVISEYEKHNINIYFYLKEEDFKLQNKAKSINPLEQTGYLEPSSEPQQRPEKSIYSEVRLLVLLSLNSPENYQNIMQAFNLENDDGFMKRFIEQQQRDYYYYFANMDVQGDYNNVIAADIHNLRTQTNNTSRMLMKMIADDLRKLKAKNLQEYLHKKIWLGKKTQEDFNVEFNNNLLKLIDTSFEQEIQLKKEYDKDLEINGEYYRQAFDYPPIMKLLNSKIKELKKYISNYVLKNNDMYKYSFDIHSDKLKNIIDVPSYDSIDNTPFQYILNGADTYLRAEELVAILRNVIWEVDHFVHDEVTRMQSEMQAQLSSQ